MGAFGSRGGLFLNAPLKRGSCTDDDAQDLPKRRELDKAVRKAGLGEPDLGEASLPMAKNIHRKGGNW